MKTEQNKLDGLKGKNPFKVPDGYTENLSSHIMSQLPEKPVIEARKVTLVDRMKPWVYMAAMFAGLGLFFKTFIANPEDGAGARDTLFVYTDDPYDVITTYQDLESEEFFDYIEAQYTDVLLADEWRYYE